MLRLCPTCYPHPYQDSKYGPKMRVKNHCVNHTSEAKDDGYRCTVCLAIEKPAKPTKPVAK